MVDHSSINSNAAMIRNNNNPTGGKTWTDEHIAELKRLRAEKFSASEIASELTVKFGVRRTRNSIVGICDRLKIPLLGRLAMGANGKPLVRHRTRSIAGRERAMEEALASRPTVPVRPPVYKPPARPKPNGAQPVGLLEATRCQCRWPLTEVQPFKDFLFCGAATVGDTSWCLEHFRIARAP